MILPPPRSTLLPYATLFRSSPHTWAFTDLSDRLLPDPVSINRGAAWGASEAAAQSGTVHLANDDGLLTPRKDRKSTRLNPSHATISYAVVCLKKNDTSSPVR